MPSAPSQSDSARPTSALPAGRQRDGFLREFRRLAGGYWRGRGCWRAWGLTAGLALLTLALVLLQMRLNLWIADLFDSLERRSSDHFVVQVTVFAAIIGGTVLASAAYQVVKRRLQLSWRDWLTTRVTAAWLDRARHYRLALLPGAHEHPDGRIAEDIRIATEWAVELAQTLLYCVATLAGFVGILWSLSGLVFVGAVPVHGHLVWIALLYAALGSAVAFMLGRRLVRATGARQGMEAGFRVGLVRAREAAEPIALACAETAERGRLARLFAGVAAAWHRQTVYLARLTLFTAGYAVLTPVFAILFATPRYLIGTISLGELMQTGQAFQQVTNSLSWPIDQFSRIAEWRASVERVLALTKALARLEAEQAPSADAGVGVCIERTETAGSSLVVSDLEVATADGATVAPGIDLSVAPGERVLVTGDPGALAALFRALAGLWPWGRGHIALPKECADGALAFVGPRPWLPAGEPLRRMLCFPRDTADFSDAALADALARVGLAPFADRLDVVEVWDRVLAPGNQQRLAIARLLVQRPAWVVLHDATDALDPRSEADLTCTLAEALPEATMLVLGRPAMPAELFGRRLTLEHLHQVVLLQDGRARSETHS
jgi:vitamin B12/bleomycin/antimicrobial peptide transport system ATP-binding/permease protein